MLSFLRSRPSAVTCVTTATVWIMFCVDVGLSFIANPAHRKPHRVKHQLFVSSLPRELVAVGDNATHFDWFPAFEDSSTYHDPSPPADALRTLVPLNFEEDIRRNIDIDRPYYALQNERSINDVTTGESEGFFCTVKREMPISREGGGISMGEVGRHSAAAASVAASLKNGITGRFHYLASDYSWEVHKADGTVHQELSTVVNGDEFDIPTISDPDDCIIFCRCHEVAKRDAKVKVYFENKAVLYILDIKFTIVPARVFKMKYASHIPANDQVSINYNRNPYHEDSIKMSCLEIEDCFNGCLHDDWVTVEGSLDAVKNCDCVGHFYKGCAPATPHSLVLFHNVDLIGQAISKLTGRNIPYKKSPKEKCADDTWSIQMENWRCTPENLNFANTEGLSLQVRAFLSDGLLGESGSKYSVQCSVCGVESGTLSYASTSVFVLAQAEA